MENLRKIACSVPILTLNSEVHLEKCLQSVKDFDDVYIVDGNSTDKTHDIARKYGAPIHKQVDTDEPNVRISDFSKVRLRAYGLARNDWILILDSDEYLSDGLIEEIRSALAIHGNETDIAFMMERRSVIAGKEIDHAFSKEVPIRLYNEKSGVAYRPDKPVHEKLHIPDGTRIIEFKHPFYSDTPASYKACIAKDDQYLGIVWEKMRNEKSERPYIWWLILRSAIEGMLRGLKMLIVSVAIYMRYGYGRSLPFPHVWRSVRYQFRLSILRTRQFFLNVMS